LDVGLFTEVGREESDLVFYACPLQHRIKEENIGMKSRWSFCFGLSLAAVALAVAPTAHADTYQTYNLDWYNFDAGVDASGTIRSI